MSYVFVRNIVISATPRTNTDTAYNIKEYLSTRVSPECHMQKKEAQPLRPAFV